MNLNIQGRTRKDILDVSLSVGRKGAHIGPSLSLVEIILAVLEEMSAGDKIILSKGHGALGYYASMHQKGMISDEQFYSFETDGGEFPGQPSRTKSNCIDYSSGSLGMGLSYAAGLAYCNRSNRYFVLIGDGEANEGSIWEGAGFAKTHNLDNITVIVDNNGLQSDGKTADILDLDLPQIWKAYGWSVETCDGCDINAIKNCIRNKSAMPKVIVAHTVKGKGVSFMENNNEWHHHELTQKDYDIAIKEIEGQYGLR